MNFTSYNIAVLTIEQNQPVDPGTNTNGFTVINTGTVTALVNGIPLNAGIPGTSNGESFSIGGNYGEIFKGRLDISFPTSGNGQVLVIQKFYL
jgi:hypothetical protein